MPLYEDDRLLAVEKPAGLSMATSSRDPGAAGRVVAALLEASGIAPSSDPPLLVHRLDVGTSGVVLLAKSEASHRELTRFFQERRVSKTYRALVFGHPVPARGVFDAPLGRDKKDGRKMAVNVEGKPAVTRYETLKRFAGLADLALFPETGRTHQIRVHLAAKGHPIAGDDLYGGATRWRGVRNAEVRRLLSRLTHPLLHAERIVIPAWGVEVASPLPADHRAVLDAAAR
jgi:23S rRNA pseudouridine1911/1915/1917 synthase